jgi:hypothetical protein
METPGNFLETFIEKQIHPMFNLTQILKFLNFGGFLILPKNVRYWEISPEFLTEF